MYYESDPLNEAPFFEIPSHQYGPKPCGGDPDGGPRQNFSLLEPMRPFLWSGYNWKAFPIPSAAYLLSNTSNGGTGCLPFEQREDRVVVAPGSWLVGFSGFSAQAAGFRFQIYDVGAGDYCLNDGFDDLNSGAQANPADTDPAMPHILPEPYCVVSPGLLQIRIVNSASVNNDMQLLLHFAVPVDATPYRGKWGN